MRKVNAVQLRPSVRKLVDLLEKTGQPVVLANGQEPVAAVISMRDYNERFVERAAAGERQSIMDEMDRIAIRSKDETTVVDVVRDLRGV